MTLKSGDLAMVRSRWNPNGEARLGQYVAGTPDSETGGEWSYFGGGDTDCEIDTEIVSRVAVAPCCVECGKVAPLEPDAGMCLLCLWGPPVANGCNCTGLDHRQSCPEWVLPY